MWGVCVSPLRFIKAYPCSVVRALDHAQYVINWKCRIAQILVCGKTRKSCFTVLHPIPSLVV